MKRINGTCITAFALTILAAVCAAFVLAAGPVYADSAVTYIDESGSEQSITTYTRLNGMQGFKLSEDVNGGWYVAEKTSKQIKIGPRVQISGNVKIILEDGANLNCSSGIHVSSNSSLTIYGQSKQDGKLKAAGADKSAAIGGDMVSWTSGECCGDIAIYGGNITAEALGSGAGIGGSDSGNVRSVTIGGGTVTAKGSSGSAGIGGGGKNGGDYGEYVINITGGTVSARGLEGGAGIGNGDSAKARYIINISGGNVTASASKETLTDHKYSKAIGQGAYAGTVKVNITGGTITASTDDKSNQCSVFDINTFDYPDCMVIATRPNGLQVIPAAKDRLSALVSMADKYNKFVIMPCDHRNAEISQHDATYHFGKCPNCGVYWDKLDESSHHVWRYEAGSTTHKRICKICKYEETKAHSGTVDDPVCECGHGLVLISFISGGGTGEMDAVIAANDIDFTLPECKFISPDSREFAGWKIGDTNEIKAAGMNTAITEDTVLEAIWSGSWKDLKERMADGGEITLYTDYIADNSGNGSSEEDGMLIVPEGKTVVLDLNGFVINRNRIKSAENGGVIKVEGDLKITDNSSDGKGEIRGGSSLTEAGGITIDGGTLTLEGGSITENTGNGNFGSNATNPGAVTILNNGKFIMNGGYLNDNNGLTAGAVQISEGSFTMNGGSIFSNTGILTGGVQVISGSFEMNGGTIVENTGMFDTMELFVRGLHGSGGVTIEGSNAEFTMSGGAISRNGQGSGIGNGVRLINGSFNIKGRPVISDNSRYYPNGSDGSVDDGIDDNGNVYLESDKTITVAGTLQPEALIGITTAVSPEAGSPVDITDGFATGGTQQGAAECFVSDKTDYAARVSTEGEVILIAKNKIKLINKDTSRGTAEVNKAEAFEGEEVTVTARPEGAYSPYVTVKSTEDGSVIIEDMELTVKDNAFTGSFKMPDLPVTVIVDFTGAGEPPFPESAVLMAKLKSKGSSSLTFSWNKLKGADGYDIFLVKNGKKAAPKLVKTIKGNKTFKWTKKGLKKKTAYKAYVKAWVMSGGEKTYGKKSPMVYAYTSGGKVRYTTAKSVTVKKAKVSLKKGSTYKIKADVIKLDKSKKLMPIYSASKLCYLSNNKNVAAVSKAGRIKAIEKGTCYIYAYARNGVYKKIKIIVK